MAKVSKSQPDKFLKIVKKGEQVEAPPPLGQPAGETNWNEHIDSGHRIKTFSKVVDDGKGNKQILMNKPNPGMIFMAIKEPIKDGVKLLPYHWVWIYCIHEKTGRIAFKENSGNIDFVDWDVPKKSKDDLPSLDESLADKVRNNPDMHVK